MFASTEIFPAHAFGFCLFFLFSMLNITIISRLMGSGVTGSGKLNTNLAWYPAIYLLTFVGCFIAYIVHNKYCLSGVYSVFGALEVIMISSNIMFWHYSDGMEWSSYTISIEWIVWYKLLPYYYCLIKMFQNSRFVILYLTKKCTFHRYNILKIFSLVIKFFWVGKDV